MTTIDSNHLTTALAVYDAFGRGDIPFILDQLADDVSWDHGIRATEVPWLQPATGKAGVIQFFTALGAGLQFTTFEPVAVTVSGNIVVGVIREVGVALATGAAIEEDLWVHVWTFGPDGKVQAFRHVGDLARHEAALRG